MTKEQIIEAVKNMTVLELNDLVKAIEEEFGVTAAAPVAVVGGLVQLLLKKKLNLMLFLHLLEIKKLKLLKLYVKSLVLDLKKRKKLLITLQKQLKKEFLKKKLKKLKLNLKKLELALKLSNPSQARYLSELFSPFE